MYTRTAGIDEAEHVDSGVGLPAAADVVRADEADERDDDEPVGIDLAELRVQKHHDAEQ